MTATSRLSITRREAGGGLLVAPPLGAELVRELGELGHRETERIVVASVAAADRVVALAERGE